jgi:hypothetical protein
MNDEALAKWLVEMIETARKAKLANHEADKNSHGSGYAEGCFDALWSVFGRMCEQRGSHAARYVLRDFGIDQEKLRTPVTDFNQSRS